MNGTQVQVIILISVMASLSVTAVIMDQLSEPTPQNFEPEQDEESLETLEAEDSLENPEDPESTESPSLINQSIQGLQALYSDLNQTTN